MVDCLFDNPYALLRRIFPQGKELKVLVVPVIGSPAMRMMRSITFRQWWGLCSVSTYSTFRLASGSSAAYLSTVPFFKAAATIADTLNVFLLLALPMDALKFPNVPITEPFTLRISGAFSYFPDRLNREACQRLPPVRPIFPGCLSYSP